MKRIPIPSLIIGLAIIAGFFLLFPAEIVGLMILLMAMVAYQIVLVRRHLTPIPSRSEGAGETARFSPIPNPESFSQRSKKEDQKAKASSKSPDETTVSNVLDGELFSRFRQHLESVESSTGTETSAVKEKAPTSETSGKKQPPAAHDEATMPLDDIMESDGVQVKLSSAARKKSQAEKTQATAKPEVTKRTLTSAPSVNDIAKKLSSGPKETKGNTEESDTDIFSDLRPQPLPKKTAGLHPRESESKESGKLTAPPKSETKKDNKREEGLGRGGKASSSKEKANSRKDIETPRAEDEIQAALSAPDSLSEGQEDGAILQRMVDDALAKGDLTGAQAGLEQLLAIHGDRPMNMPWQVRLSQARLAARKGDTKAAVNAFDALLNLRPSSDEKELSALAGEVASPVSGDPAPELHATLLQRVLGVFRQLGDQEAMDRMYQRIEPALEAAGDEKKLMQHLQNHLEIRKALSNLEGQLELIDLIGNRYYKLGDTDQAQHYYEEGLRLREQQEATGTASAKRK